MSSHAGRRRMERPVGAPAQRPDERRRGLLSRIAISPAMLGTVALLAAGIGSFASADAAEDDDLVSLGYEAAGAFRPGEQTRNLDAGVDVSRSFDRKELARQTALQTRQRARALSQIDRDIEARSSDLEEEKAKRDKAAERKRRDQWVMPVTGYTLTARFGQRSSMWSSGSHTGLDFAGPSGSKIVALAAGTVKSTGYEGSYGNRTVITLADGTEIAYCHQSRIVVSPGDKVLPGDVTGYTGATGNVTGPHLHLEVELPGSGLVDPEGVLREHGINP